MLRRFVSFRWDLDVGVVCDGVFRISLFIGFHLLTKSIHIITKINTQSNTGTSTYLLVDSKKRSLCSSKRGNRLGSCFPLDMSSGRSEFAVKFRYLGDSNGKLNLSLVDPSASTKKGNLNSTHQGERQNEIEVNKTERTISSDSKDDTIELRVLANQGKMSIDLNGKKAMEEFDLVVENMYCFNSRVQCRYSD